MSDTICIENGYSIVENPKAHGKSYNKWLGEQAETPHKEQLRMAIDAALQEKPESWESLLRLLEEAGFEAKRRGNTLSFWKAGWKNNVRFRSLGQGYTEEELRAVIAGEREHNPKNKYESAAKTKPVNLLVDIQEKL